MFLYDVMIDGRRDELDTQRKNSETTPKPMYFRFLTLVAFHAFLSLKVPTLIPASDNLMNNMPGGRYGS